MSEEENKNTKDIAKLRHDVDVLKKQVHAQPKRIYQTDFSQHIEDLDKDIKKRKSANKIKAVNSFTVEQKVKLVSSVVSLHAIAPGTIKFIACNEARPLKTRSCDKKTCTHNSKDYIWVQWSTGKMYAYHFTHLQLLTEDDTKPRIGKELSGRIGEWEYNADKKTWKRDGFDKEYTNEEFEDVVYFETHPYAKDEGIDFIKALKRETEAEKEMEAIK